MIEWSIEVLRACESVGSIVVAVPPEHDDELGGQGLTLVPGGATRSQSVANALETVETGLVAIHDAARPLATAELVEELVTRLEAAPLAAAVIPAVPVADTVKQAAEVPEGSRIAFDTPGVSNAVLVGRTLDRSRLWAAQTPQVFRTTALRAALAVDQPTRDAATDEAMLVEAAGEVVLIHPAPPENLKVTTPLDLEIAELLLSRRAAP